MGLTDFIVDIAETVSPIPIKPLRETLEQTTQEQAKEAAAALGEAAMVATMGFTGSVVAGKAIRQLSSHHLVPGKRLRHFVHLPSKGVREALKSLPHALHAKRCEKALLENLPIYPLLALNPFLAPLALAGGVSCMLENRSSDKIKEFGRHISRGAAQVTSGIISTFPGPIKGKEVEDLLLDAALGPASYLFQ